MKNNKLKIHKEKLYHFSCGSCKKWWSVADADADADADEKKDFWYCPWCGEKQEIK